LIDLHISQIRPDNLDQKSYVPEGLKQFPLDPRFNTIGEENFENKYFEYFHRFREVPSSYISKHEREFADLKANLPTTDHPTDWGTKYDVEWTNEQKFPHVANRLGYPMLAQEPLDTIFGIERAPAHPGYQFQPFVQTPSMDPDPTLNFDVGETIYENRQVLEWARFYKIFFTATAMASPAFYGYEFYKNEGAPSLGWLSENFNWFQIPRQFQDGGDINLNKYLYCDNRDYMNMQHAMKRLMVKPVHTAHLAVCGYIIYYVNFDYVTKMTYNKDKDLVFVYKPDAWWNEKEYVHEVHHLEHVVPASVTTWKEMSAMKDDGIITISDLS
jgi:hypothetical protein